MNRRPRGSYFARLFLREHMGEREWWRQVGLGSFVDHPSIQDEVDDFGVWLAVGFVVSPFNLFEAAIRRVMRAMDPDTNRDGQPIASVFRDCLGRISLAWPEDSMDFLDLYRLIRNTIHNNGRHYGRRGSETRSWRAREYRFPHGEPLEFMAWPLYIELVRTLGSLNEAVMTTPEVALLPAIN